MSFLEKHKDEILDYVGHDIELEIVPDYTLNENACTIETDAGIFDCGVDVQLDNLMKVQMHYAHRGEAAEWVHLINIFSLPIRRILTV